VKNKLQRAVVGPYQGLTSDDKAFLNKPTDLCI
jgi:hypothetical protein